MSGHGRATVAAFTNIIISTELTMPAQLKQLVRARRARWAQTLAVGAVQVVQDHQRRVLGSAQSVELKMPELTHFKDTTHFELPKEDQ